MHASDGGYVLQMIFHSRPIAIVLLIDMVALLMYNFSGMCVTGKIPHPCNVGHTVYHYSVVHAQTH